MNPELIRNIRLECTTLRVGGAAVLIGLSLIAIVLTEARGPVFEDTGWTHDVLSISHYAAMALVAFWGARKAADAVGEEMRERTWDQQRLSGLGPLPMTIGKVLGAGSAVLAILAMLLVVQATVIVIGPTPPYGWDFLFFNNVRVGAFGAVLLHIAAAVLVFATAFFAALVALNGQDRPRAFDATLFQIVSVAACIWLLGLLSSERRSLYATNVAAPDGARHIEWWGVSLSDMIWANLWIWVFALWALYGGYHQMRRAFAMATSTTPWILFLGFVAVWGAGFAPGGERLAAFFALAIAAYAAVLIEPHKLTAYRGWGAQLARVDPRALVSGPAWLYAWLGATGVAVSALAGGALEVPNWVYDTLDVSGPAAIAAAALFLLRDMGVAVWAGLRASDGRGVWAALVILAALHVLGPALSFAMIGFDGLRAFAPVGVVSLISAAIQAALVWSLCATELGRSVTQVEAG